MLTKLTGLVAIAAAFLAFGGQTASAEEVLLRSKQSGKYVTVANGLLAASAGSADRALRLDMQRLDGRTVAFRVVADNTYVRAGVGGGTFLATGSPHARGWERFRLMALGGSAHALESVQNGKLVRAGVGPGSRLAAVSTGKPRGWEIFDIVPARAIQPQGEQARSGVSEAVRGTWRIEQVATAQTGHLVRLDPALSQATRIDIGAGGGLRARAGCNTITATIVQHGGAWRSSAPMQTKMMCPDRAAMNVERSFTQALGAASRVTMRGSRMTLKNPAGETVLVLRRL